MFTLFDQERINELNQMEAERKTADTINKLNSLLFDANRYDDAKRASREPEYQQKLFREFGLA